MADEPVNSKIGPLPDEAFEGDPIFNPDVDKAYGPESQARLAALKERLKGEVSADRAKKKWPARRP
jgi:hypothetical protein